jgi:hypothetical protein
MFGARIATGCLAVIVSAAMACGSANASSQLTGQVPMTQANIARDGNIAIHEEFDMAVLKGTADALQLFLLRHPDHPLAAEAAERLRQLTEIK